MSFFDKLDKIKKGKDSRIEEKPKKEKPKDSIIEKPKSVSAETQKKRKRESIIIRKWKLEDFGNLLAKFIYEGLEAGLLQIIKNSQKRGVRLSEILTILPIPKRKVYEAIDSLLEKGLIYRDKNGYYHYKRRVDRND